MVEVYALRHMFQGTLEGENVPIFFTRDTEHLIANLSQKDRDEAVSKGWVTVTSVPTMAELRGRAKEAHSVETGKGGKKGGAK